MSIFLDYLYMFRFPAALIVTLIFLIVSFILKDKKKRKTCRLLFICSLAVTVAITVCYFALPGQYKAMSVDEAEKIINVTQKNLNYIADRDYLEFAKDNDVVRISVEKFNSKQEAAERYKHEMDSFNLGYGVDEKTDKKLVVSNDLGSVYVTPLVYYDRCIIMLPIANNYYVSEAYVLLDDVIVTFTCESTRRNNVTIIDAVNNIDEIL